MKAINIIFDGPPSRESGRFVEVEDDAGRSICAGEWIKRPDGLWALRITELPDGRHIHQKNPDSPRDDCLQCGLDLRNAIHARGAV